MRKKLAEAIDFTLKTGIFSAINSWKADDLEFLSFFAALQ